MSSPASSLQRRPDAERQQIYEALVEVCREGGLARATSERVIERAEVDRAAFARHFSDLDDCFAQYIRDACEGFLGRARAALEATEDWRTQLRTVVHEMVEFWGEDEGRAHMLLVETFAAGPLGGPIGDQMLEMMVDLIDRGRLLMEDPTALTRVTAEAMAGALLHQMHLLQVEGSLDEAGRLVPQLMYFLVLPYLGVEAAVEELSWPPIPEP